MFTDFILVRHGETDYNKLHVIQGWVDIPLNETGHQQAAVTAEMLREEKIDEVWHSDLQRAAKTAEAILKNHPGVPAYPCVPLREWKLGFIQNMSHAELEKEYPEYEEMLKTESIELAVPGGESRSEFQKRVNMIFEELAERSPGKRLLIVSHGGVLVRFYRFLCGKDSAKEHVPIPGNASVSRARYDHETGQWSLIVWNQIYTPQPGKTAEPPAL